MAKFQHTGIIHRILIVFMLFATHPGIKFVSGQYDTSCTCDSVSSSVCIKYTCSITQKSSSCFPGSSHVQLKDGTLKRLEDVEIDDDVIVGQNRTSEPLLTFIHAKREGLFTFLAMKIKSAVSEKSSTLYVSPNHLIFDFDSKQARFASTFHTGDRVEYIDQDTIVPGEVVAIGLTKKEGFYAPLTSSGKIVIDNVVASNYATVSNHELAHKTMVLYRWMLELFGGQATWGSDVPTILQFLLDITGSVQNTIVGMFLNTQLHDGTFQVSSIQ